MEPEGVVIPAPAIGQALGLSHRGEQLGVEEFIPEPAVERLGIAVLPWGAWLDVRGGRTAALAPAPQGMGNELGAVIAADECRCWVEAGELLQHRHHVFGFAASSDADRQAQTAVLIDHVQELQPPTIGGGIELEVHGPDLMRVHGLVTPHGAVGWTSPLLISRCRALEPFLAP
jgi:hypothetical protein